MRSKKTKPSSEVLRDLYEVQKLTSREVGEKLGFPHISILRWIRKYGIPVRAPHDGLANRGIEAPTKEQLEQFVHVEHLSYREIAAKYGVDDTAVPYWLKKHGIKKPKTWDTRRKGVQIEWPTEQELREFYDSGMSQTAIGDLIGVTSGTISTLFRKFGIQARPNGFNGGLRWACKDGHEVRSMYEQMTDDWLSDHGIAHIYEPRLPFVGRGDFLANGWYIEVWGIDGSERYDARKSQKKNLYELHKLPLISIDRWCFDKTRDTWSNRLQQCMVPANTQGMLF